MNDTNAAVLEPHEVVNNETYGLGVVLESDARRTTVDFDEAGIKTYSTEIASAVASLPELGDYDIETWSKNLLACHHERYDAHWTIGDSLVKARNSCKKWQKKPSMLLNDAVRITGRSKQSLREYLRVASIFPKESRHLELSFSHHQTVASIEDPDKREQWLVRAENEKLNSEAFRLLVYDKKVQKVSVYVPVPKYLQLMAELDATNRERYEDNQLAVEQIPMATISDIIIEKLTGEK